VAARPLYDEQPKVNLQIIKSAEQARMDARVAKLTTPKECAIFARNARAGSDEIPNESSASVTLDKYSVSAT